MQRVVFLFLALAAVSGSAAGADRKARKADGYLGVWSFIGRAKGDFRYQSSGPMATYGPYHRPTAAYVPRMNKTLFCFAGRPADKNVSVVMVGSFDHATGTVDRPTIVLDRQNADALDNPSLAVDAVGYVWVFASSHGRNQPATVHRSRKPNNIDVFDRIHTSVFAFAQPHPLPEQGILLLHTRYADGQRLFSMSTADGRTWTNPKPTARAAEGSDQVSGAVGDKIATVMTIHPRTGLADARTNLYYLESVDGGASWRTAGGAPFAPPMTQLKNESLVRDFQTGGLRVYLHDLAFDAEQRPIVVFVTCKGAEPGPASAPFMLQTAWWNGQEWEVCEVAAVDHHDDGGCLWVDEQQRWNLLAPTAPGPFPYATGGEMVSWTSVDQGKTWKASDPLTASTDRSHAFPRRPTGAHREFAAFWADGDPQQTTPGRIYFTDQAAKRVWRLPAVIEEDSAAPELLTMDPSTEPTTQPAEK